MGQFDFESLKGFGGRTVIIRTIEGEVMRANVDWIFAHEKDLAYEVIETNQPERYRDVKSGDLTVIPWEFIEDIQLAE